MKIYIANKFRKKCLHITIISFKRVLKCSWLGLFSKLETLSNIRFLILFHHQIHKPALYSTAIKFWVKNLNPNRHADECCCATCHAWVHSPRLLFLLQLLLKHCCHFFFFLVLMVHISYLFLCWVYRGGWHCQSYALILSDVWHYSILPCPIVLVHSSGVDKSFPSMPDKILSDSIVSLLITDFRCS